MPLFNLGGISLIVHIIVVIVGGIVTLVRKIFSMFRQAHNPVIFSALPKSQLRPAYDRWWHKMASAVIIIGICVSVGFSATRIVTEELRTNNVISLMGNNRMHAIGVLAIGALARVKSTIPTSAAELIGSGSSLIPVAVSAGAKL